MGRRQWIYEEVQKQQCHQNTTEITLTLSGCSFIQDYTCDNGKCINKYQRCDDVVNCDDGSDEENCDVVKIDRYYKYV